MGAVYQLTFFFGLVLLAIFITVFVFAVSLLGRAIEAAAKVERSKIEERKRNNIKEMSAIRKEIQKAEKKGEIPRGLRQKLEKLEERNKEFDSELSKIRKAPELLTVKGGVIHPCICIILGLVLSGTASYLSTIKDISVVIPLFIWILGLSALGYSIYRLCKSLKVIEDVAVTSEEAWITKTVEAFKIAQKELEEEKKPQLALIWIEPKLPFSMKVGSTFKIEFGVYLVTGDFAENVFVTFLCPPGFDFPGREIFIQLENHPLYPKHSTAVVNYSKSLTLGPYYANSVTIKAPTNPGTYKAYYYLGCKLSVQSFEEFEITVEKSEN